MTISLKFLTIIATDSNHHAKTSDCEETSTSSVQATPTTDLNVTPATAISSLALGSPCQNVNGKNHSKITLLTFTVRAKN